MKEAFKYMKHIFRNDVGPIHPTLHMTIVLLLAMFKPWIAVIYIIWYALDQSFGRIPLI